MIVSKFSLSDQKPSKLERKSIPIIKNFNCEVLDFLESYWSSYLSFTRYGGPATDIQIFHKSEFISTKYHYPGDQLLADLGFALEEDFAAECSSELFIPAFTKGKKQLIAKEDDTTRRIATVKFHMERLIGKIKNRFRILEGPLPVTFIKSLIDECGEYLVPTIDKLVTVCVSLVSLSTGIAYSEKPCV